jgi:hypothetical protein
MRHFSPSGIIIPKQETLMPVIFASRRTLPVQIISKEL